MLRPSGGEVGLMSENVGLHGEESGLGGDVLLLQTPATMIENEREKERKERMGSKIVISYHDGKHS